MKRDCINGQGVGRRVVALMSLSGVVGVAEKCLTLPREERLRSLTGRVASTIRLEANARAEIGLISMRTRLRIQALLREGQPQADIARTFGVSVRSVKRIAKEASPRSIDDLSERRRRHVGRPSTTAAYTSVVRRILIASPKARTVAILRALRSVGYTGSKSSLYNLVRDERTRLERELPPDPPSPTRRQPQG